MRTFYAEVFFGVPPRLCLSAFTLVQPLYLRRVISFIGEENPHWFVRTGLILSCVLIFLGVAVSAFNTALITRESLSNIFIGLPSFISAHELPWSHNGSRSTGSAYLQKDA
jgi:hypothetical protein